MYIFNTLLRLRVAIQSQDHDEEPFERSSSNVDRDERETALHCSNNKLTIEDLSSNDISLQNENKDLQDKLHELESHHIILKQEAISLGEENKSF